MNAAQTWLEGRGADALLHHLQALDRAGEPRPSPQERLAEALGPELASTLLTALAPTPASRSGAFASELV